MHEIFYVGDVVKVNRTYFKGEIELSTYGVITYRFEKVRSAFEYGIKFSNGDWDIASEHGIEKISETEQERFWLMKFVDA